MTINPVVVQLSRARLQHGAPFFLKDLLFWGSACLIVEILLVFMCFVVGAVCTWLLQH